MDIVGATIIDVNVDLRNDGPLADKMDLYLSDGRVIHFRTREAVIGGRLHGAMLHITEEQTDHLAEERTLADRHRDDVRLALSICKQIGEGGRSGFGGHYIDTHADLSDEEEAFLTRLAIEAGDR